MERSGQRYLGVGLEVIARQNPAIHWPGSSMGHAPIVEAKLPQVG